jgi:hypothetical protein
MSRPPVDRWRTLFTPLLPVIFLSPGHVVLIANHELKRVICRESSWRNCCSTRDISEPGVICQMRRGGKEVKYQVIVMLSFTGINLTSAVTSGAGGTIDVPWLCV